MNYNTCKKNMLDSNIYISDDEINLDEVSLQGRLFKVSNNFLNTLKNRLSMINSVDNYFMKIINRFKEEKGLKIRSNSVSFNETENIGTVISTVSEETKDKIRYFFLGLNQKMNNIRNEKYKKYPRPEGLIYKNPELEKLKQLREEALKQLSLTNSEAMSKEEEVTLKMKNQNQYGFLNKGALLILLSVFTCLIEFTILIISKL